MACIADMDGKNQLGEERVPNHEVYGTGHRASCLLDNGNRDVEGRVIDGRIDRDVADIGRPGRGLHGLAPPRLIGLLRWQGPIGGGDDEASVIGHGHAQIMPRFACPIFEVGGGDGAVDRPMCGMNAGGFCLVAVGLGLSLCVLIRHADGEAAGAIDFIVDGAGQSNRGRARNFLEPFADRLFEAGRAGAVRGPQCRHAGHDADDQ